jgi:signal transduction histidine kinase/ActR/RegA family two-component response regulator
MSVASGRPEPARGRDHEANGAPLDAGEALERERLTMARLRRELEEVRRLSGELIVREQAARAAAEAANRSKDEFLATLSHEMRTPLNVVLGLVWRLRNRRLEPQAVSHALEVIDRNTRLQAQLVEDLLDLSRIITGKLKLHIIAVDLSGTVHESVDAVRSAADAKNIHIDVTIDPAATHVHGDPLRLQQIVWNLLSNAVKFTPHGGHVAVTLEPAGESVRLTVTDNGIGITAELLPYVFDRFCQGDSTSTRKHGGLGLGLAIVRHMAELHGGSVTATSEGEGCGARFEVLLPFGPAEYQAERRSPTDAATLRPSLDGVHVLIAEDRIDSRVQLQRSLEEYGARVVSVATISEALEEIVERPPDVLLSDVNMKDQNIDALLGKLQSLEEDAGTIIPAVAVSEYARGEDRVRALLAGFHGYASTAVSPQELAAIVASAVRRHASRSPRSGR